jgi:hypothetical protein
MAQKPFSYDDANTPEQEPQSTGAAQTMASGFGYDEAAGAKPKGNFRRGFETALRQVPQTAGGALALVGDAVGADGVRDYGMKVFKGQEAAIQAEAQPSDSATNVLEGNGNVGDFLAHGAGYVTGQAATALATGGLGGLVGKQIAGRAVAGLTAEQIAARQATGQAVGQGVALGGYNYMQEAGSIYPDAVEQAHKEGRELDGTDLARVAGAAGAAAAVETLTDTKMLHNVFHGASDAPTYLRRAASAVPRAIGREASTEALQTGIERVGSGQSLTDKDAVRDYVDSAALGGLGGGLGGAASAVIRAPEQPPVVVDPNAGPVSRAAALLATPLQDPPRTPDLTTSPGARPQYDNGIDFTTDIDTNGLQAIDPATQLRLPAPNIQVGADGTAMTGDQRHSQAQLDLEATDPVGPLETGAVGQGRNSELVARRQLPPPTVQVDPQGTATTPEQRNTQAQQDLAGRELRHADNEERTSRGLDPVDEDGTILDKGAPFKTRIKAQQAAKRNGPGFDLHPVDGGFVLRRSDADVTDVTPKESVNVNGVNGVSAAPAPEDMERRAAIDLSAHGASTSPHNELPQPTDAQKEAGNYTKGHIPPEHMHGLDVTVENARGSERSGKRPDGSTWSHSMSDHYGYIRRTKGADDEQVDAYIGPTQSDQVHIVDQVDQHTGKFDEHKVMLDYPDRDSAIAAYSSNFDPGWKVGPVTSMSVPEFKEWLKNGDTSKPVSPAFGQPELPPSELRNARPNLAPTAPADGDAASAGQAGVLPAGGNPADLAGPQAQADAAPVTPETAARYGRNGTPISEGGVPFKTKLGALQQQKNQPGTRVVKHEGGFVLRDLSDAERTAQAENGKKRQSAARAASREKNPLMLWLSDHGLFHVKDHPQSLKSEFSPDKNPFIAGGNGPVFRSNGSQIDTLLPRAIQDGFLPQGADERQFEDLVRRAMRGERVAPLYGEGQAEAEAERRAPEPPEFGELAQHDANDPFDPHDLGLEDEDLQAAGYATLSPEDQADFRALVALAASRGIDTDTILEDADANTRNQPDSAYYEAARAALEEALAGRDQRGSQGPGQQGQARGPDEGGDEEGAGSAVAPTPAPSPSPSLGGARADLDSALKDLGDVMGVAGQKPAPVSDNAGSGAPASHNPVRVAGSEPQFTAMDVVNAVLDPIAKTRAADPELLDAMKRAGLATDKEVTAKGWELMGRIVPKASGPTSKMTPQQAQQIIDDTLGRRAFDYKAPKAKASPAPAPAAPAPAPAAPAPAPAAPEASRDPQASDDDVDVEETLRGLSIDMVDRDALKAALAKDVHPTTGKPIPSEGFRRELQTELENLESSISQATEWLKARGLDPETELGHPIETQQDGTLAERQAADAKLQVGMIVQLSRMSSNITGVIEKKFIRDNEFDAPEVKQSAQYGVRWYDAGVARKGKDLSYFSGLFLRDGKIYDNEGFGSAVDLVEFKILDKHVTASEKDIAAQRKASGAAPDLLDGEAKPNAIAAGRDKKKGKPKPGPIIDTAAQARNAAAAKASAREHWKVGMPTRLSTFADIEGLGQRYTQSVAGVVESIDGDKADVRIYAGPGWETNGTEGNELHGKLAKGVDLTELGRFQNEDLQAVIDAGKLETGDAQLLKDRHQARVDEGKRKQAEREEADRIRIDADQAKLDAGEFLVDGDNDSALTGELKWSDNDPSPAKRGQGRRYLIETPLGNVQVMLTFPVGMQVGKGRLETPYGSEARGKSISPTGYRSLLSGWEPAEAMKAPLEAAKAIVEDLQQTQLKDSASTARKNKIAAGKAKKQGTPLAEQIGKATDKPAAAPAGGDLFGAAPSESLQTANKIKAGRDEKLRKEQQAAPGAEGFTLTGSDSQRDVGAAAGQTDMLETGDVTGAIDSATVDRLGRKYGLIPGKGAASGITRDKGLKGGHWEIGHDGTFITLDVHLNGGGATAVRNRRGRDVESKNFTDPAKLEAKLKEWSADLVADATPKQALTGSTEQQWEQASREQRAEMLTAVGRPDLTVDGAGKLGGFVDVKWSDLSTNMQASLRAQRGEAKPKAAKQPVTPQVPARAAPASAFKKNDWALLNGQPVQITGSIVDIDGQAMTFVQAPGQVGSTGTPVADLTPAPAGFKPPEAAPTTADRKDEAKAKSSAGREAVRALVERANAAGATKLAERLRHLADATKSSQGKDTRNSSHIAPAQAKALADKFDDLLARAKLNPEDDFRDVTVEKVGRRPSPEELKAKADLLARPRRPGRPAAHEGRRQAEHHARARAKAGADPGPRVRCRVPTGRHQVQDGRQVRARSDPRGLGQEVADAITIDHLQGAYISMAGKYREQGSDTAKTVVGVESKAEIEAEPTYVPGTSDSVERDSGEPTADAGVGATVPGQPGADGASAVDTADQSGNAPGSDGRQGDPVLPPSGPAVVGVGGDQRLPGGSRPAGPESSATGTELDQRGRDPREQRVPPEPIPAGAVVASSTRGTGEAGKRAAQRRANDVPVKLGDLDNIREALPYLLPGQQEDVHKAETRFAKRDGYGMLFTNGTGTGKTFSGLGIVKRQERQNKLDQLIIVPDEKIGDDWMDSGKPLDLAITG